MKVSFVGLLALLFLIPTVHAADVSIEDSIIGLYVAYYNRAPDSAGFNFWKEQARKNGNTTALKSISEGFAKNSQFTKDYPSTLSNKEFITKIYQNILNRAPDDEGLNFWETRLTNGLSRSDFIIEYVNDVLNYTGDSEEGKKSTLMFKNKLDVSRFFMDTLKDASNGSSGTTAYTRSIEVLSAITDNLETISLAKSQITKYCKEATTQCSISSSESFNLILKDNAGSSQSKSCNYKKIQWNSKGELELILEDFENCL